MDGSRGAATADVLDRRQAAAMIVAPGADCIVGIAAFFHDSACCVLKGGRLVAAAQEERFSRIKHDASFPVRALRSCLRDADVTVADVDCVAYYEHPGRKLERQLWSAGAALSSSGAAALSDPSRPEREIRERLGFDGPVELVGHHESHAASAFFYSGMPEAAVLVVDAVGEWATTSYGRGAATGLEIFDQVDFPDSIGLLYSTITAYLGFEVNDGEYKVMGLAPYGSPRYLPHLRRLIEPLDDGRFRLALEYFDYIDGTRMYSDALEDLLGHPPHPPEGEPNEFAADLARSVQALVEQQLLSMVDHLHRRVPSHNLCMAGGVALNSVANGRIAREGPFDRLFVQPAAGDAGGALGAAAAAFVKRTTTAPEPMRHACLGPAHGDEEIARLLATAPMTFIDHRRSADALLQSVCDRLCAGSVVGWSCGRMEFGPRALGSRSILADPRQPAIRDRINAVVKRREAFRPFAPAVLADRASEHFGIDHPSPYMLETCQVISPLALPAVTHVDGSARVQTVDRTGNPRFHALLEAFASRTGCPILLNTSLNLRGEPIARTPLDALLCFMRSDMDCLVLEDFILDRSMLGKGWRAWLAGRPRRVPPARQLVYRFA